MQRIYLKAIENVAVESSPIAVNRPSSRDMFFFESLFLVHQYLQECKWIFTEFGI
jgi:hypothetical protein